MTETPVARRVEYMRLDEIRGALRNPKTHDGDGIHRSITHFGLADLPVLDERTGLLVSGHGRLEQLVVMVTEESERPDGVGVDDEGMWLVPVIRGWASKSDADADAYLVAANRLMEQGGWDQLGLGDLLSDLNSFDPALLEVAGFSQGDLAALFADDTSDTRSQPGEDDRDEDWNPSPGPRPAEPPDEFPSYDPETIETEYKCPRCSYEWSGTAHAN